MGYTDIIFWTLIKVIICVGSLWATFLNSLTDKGDIIVGLIQAIILSVQALLFFRQTSFMGATVKEMQVSNTTTGAVIEKVGALADAAKDQATQSLNIATIIQQLSTSIDQHTYLLQNLIASVDNQVAATQQLVYHAEQSNFHAANHVDAVQRQAAAAEQQTNIEQSRRWDEENDRMMQERAAAFSVYNHIPEPPVALPLISVPAVPTKTS